MPPPFFRRWMTSWIQTKPLCQLFKMIYLHWHWSTKSGHHRGHSQHIRFFRSHLHSAIWGLVWCGMITPKPIPNHWLTNGNVLWNSTLVPHQHLIFLKANNFSSWTKSWNLIHGMDCWFMPCIATASW